MLASINETDHRPISHLLSAVIEVASEVDIVLKEWGLV
jgi:hypothetical protein